MLRFFLSAIGILMFIPFFSQSALYSSNNKKAIKLYEKAIVCFNDIDPLNNLF